MAWSWAVSDWVNPWEFLAPCSRFSPTSRQVCAYVWFIVSSCVEAALKPEAAPSAVRLKDSPSTVQKPASEVLALEIMDVDFAAPESRICTKRSILSVSASLMAPAWFAREEMVALCVVVEALSLPFLTMASA